MDSAKAQGATPQRLRGMELAALQQELQLLEASAAKQKAAAAAAQTAALLGGSGGSEVVQELRSLRDDNRVQARSIAALNLRMTRVFERWDGDGLPETRVETV